MHKGKWDVRVPSALRMMVIKGTHGVFLSRGARTNRTGALRIVSLLAEAYGVSPPTVRVSVAELRERGANAMYDPNVPEGEVIMYGTNHVKSIFHEFYHHLDRETRHAYNSSDARSYAWQFAELMYAEIKGGQK
jgi:hypothetical protein